MTIRWRHLCLAAAAVALYCVLSLVAQAPSVTPVLAQVQLNPAGSPLTSQNAWMQTATGAATANTVTQPGAPGKTNYVTGFEITGSGSTAGTPIAITLGSGGTTIANYSLTPGLIASLNQVNMSYTFNPPLVGSGPGQNIVLTVPSFGAGNTAASVTLHGFSQ